MRPLALFGPVEKLCPYCARGCTDEEIGPHMKDCPERERHEQMVREIVRGPRPWWLALLLALACLGCAGMS